MTTCFSLEIIHWNHTYIMRTSHFAKKYSYYLYLNSLKITGKYSDKFHIKFLKGLHYIMLVLTDMDVNCNLTGWWRQTVILFFDTLFYTTIDS